MYGKSKNSFYNIIITSSTCGRHFEMIKNIQPSISVNQTTSLERKFCLRQILTSAAEACEKTSTPNCHHHHYKSSLGRRLQIFRK